MLFGASAFAHTYIVGPGAGSDFPDIPSAIAAAQPGDVLVVRPGSYSGGFTLDKGLTILGTSTVTLSGAAEISSLPAEQRAVVVNLSPAGIVVDQCDGPVILQQLTSSQAMTVSASADVRCLSIDVTPPGLPTISGLVVNDSRVEIVNSTLRGSSDAPGSGSAAGGTGLVCAIGSRVHVAATSVYGGSGQMAFAQGIFAGDGAPGIVTSQACELILAGNGLSNVSAGAGGLNWGYDICCFDGEGTNAVQNYGTMWFSGVAFQPTDGHASYPKYDDFHCCEFTWTFTELSGPGAWTDVTPNDPTLSISGTPANGATVTLMILGPAGAHAWLELGRRTALVSDPNTQIEELVDPVSTLDLGTIPANGQASFSFNLPGFAGMHHYLPLPPGAFFVAQGLVTLEVGGMRRTNSIPIVGR
jgi:hypothetical protein